MSAPKATITRSELTRLIRKGKTSVTVVYDGRDLGPVVIEVSEPTTDLDLADLLNAVHDHLVDRYHQARAAPDGEEVGP